MFIMEGEEVKLVRHVISYTENETEMQEMCISDEHRNEMKKILTDRGIEFTSESVNQTENEWFNGLYFDSYDKAKGVYEAGEAAYLQVKRTAERTDRMQLRADVDFLSIITGVGV